MLFHLRRLVTEYGGLRPVIACVRNRSISHHVLDLWQRTYHSLPSTLLRYFRAPPQAGNASCLDSAKIRLQRFPTVELESALFPPKGLITVQPFAKGDTIATFAKNDSRLRLLLLQHKKLPFPTATACLVPFPCHCGSTHLRLQATDDLSANTILLLSEPHEWQGCLVQFDGSAHKHIQTGGAGVSLLSSNADKTKRQVGAWLDHFGLVSQHTAITLHTDAEIGVAELVGRSVGSYSFVIRRAAPQQHQSIGGAERAVRELKESLAVLRADLNLQSVDIVFSEDGLTDVLTYCALCHNHFSRARGTEQSPLEMIAGKKLSTCDHSVWSLCSCRAPR